MEEVQEKSEEVEEKGEEEEQQQQQEDDADYVLLPRDAGRITSGQENVRPPAGQGGKCSLT